MSFHPFVPQTNGIYGRTKSHSIFNRKPNYSGVGVGGFTSELTSKAAPLKANVQAWVVTR